MGRAQIRVENFTGKPICALVCSVLNGGDVRLQMPFIKHFADKHFFLLYFNSVHYYPSVLKYIVEHREDFSAFLPVLPDGIESLRFFFKEEDRNISLHEAVIDKYLRSVLQKEYARITTCYLSMQEGMKPGGGVGFIRDVFFRTAEGSMLALINERSLMRNAFSNTPYLELLNCDSTLVNGGFWVGPDYLLVGVSEFMRSGTLRVLDKDKQIRLQTELSKHFINARDFPIIWLQAEPAVNYAGLSNYFPFAGHLDDFLCPIKTETSSDIYLYADLDPAYYCGLGDALSPGIVELQQPLLANIEMQLTGVLKLKGRVLEAVKIPVLWDDAAFYPYTNCIVDYDAGATILNMPSYRVRDDDRFNRVSGLCELEIERRIAKRFGQSVVIRWVKDYNFTDSVRSAKGSLHCLISAVY
ncbi:MAG: hypothetical protein U0V74_01805 [Chitinophagales bacterium]